MSLYGIVRTPLYRSMVPSLAHHQVLLQSQTPTQKARIWLCETIVTKCHCGQKCDGRNLIVLDPWSICFDICLCTSSVTPRSHNLSSSLNSSKYGHHAWYCSCSLREPELEKLHFLTDIMIPNREDCWYTGHVHAHSNSEIRARVLARPFPKGTVPFGAPNVPFGAPNVPFGCALWVCPKSNNVPFGSTSKPTYF